MKRIDAAIAILTRSGKILICQRKENDTFGGYWEFPGGKREPGESLEQALARELREELAITATPLHRFDPVVHDYKTAVVTLHPFLCDFEAGEPRLIECQATCWIEPEALRKYKFPPANEDLIEKVIAHLAGAAEQRHSRGIG
jgi:mutator protein MutT